MAIALVMEEEGVSASCSSPLDLATRRWARRADREEQRFSAAASRARLAASVRWRRRLVVMVLVAVLTTLLALPVALLGGSPVAPMPGAPDAAVSTSTVYVVQPGDTIWSIAAKFDRSGSPRALAEAIAAQTGSAVVVPGERIDIP